MASFGQPRSRSRDAFQSIIASLYKFALVLTVNEDLARQLLRGTCKGLNLRKDFGSEEREHLIEAMRRMYFLWSSKLGEDPNAQKRCQPDPRLFAACLPKGTFEGDASFAKFIVNMSSSQRAALYLVYGEGASYDEAAEVTAVDILSLMKLLARGHVALSRWLDHRELSEEYESDCSPGRERAA